MLAKPPPTLPSGAFDGHPSIYVNVLTTTNYTSHVCVQVCYPTFVLVRMYMLVARCCSWFHRMFQLDLVAVAFNVVSFSSCQRHGSHGRPAFSFSSQRRGSSDQYYRLLICAADSVIQTRLIS